MSFLKETAYRILEFFSGSKGLSKTINGIKLRLPVRYINYFPADYEDDNFNFLKQQLKQDDVVLDIGAHIGLFATIAAKLTGSGGKVYAFEPAAETNELLKKTIAINGLQNVILPYKAAMGAATGKTTFYISAIKGDNSNSLVSYKADRDLYAVEVDVFSIDNFVEQSKLPKVDFIKIDVEGAEYDALLGASGTLKKFRPVCIIAIHPVPIAAKGDSLKKIYDFIDEHGYYIYLENMIISKQTFCNNTDLIDLHLLPAGN